MRTVWLLCVSDCEGSSVDAVFTSRVLAESVLRYMTEPDGDDDDYGCSYWVQKQEIADTAWEEYKAAEWEHVRELEDEE